MKKEKQKLAVPTTNTAEIAAALGVTPQAVAKRSKKEAWTAIGRACPGGAVYDLSTLTPRTATAVLKRRMRHSGWRARLAQCLHRIAWYIDGVRS